MSASTEAAELSDREQLLLESWNQTHKKTALLHLILLRLSRQDAGAEDLAAYLTEVSDGYLAVDAKSLYRTLRRLTENGLIGYDEFPVQRSGVKRKEYGITESGLRMLKIYQATTLSYLARINDDAQALEPEQVATT